MLNSCNGRRDEVVYRAWLRGHSQTIHVPGMMRIISIGGNGWGKAGTLLLINNSSAKNSPNEKIRGRALRSTIMWYISNILYWPTAYLIHGETVVLKIMHMYQQFSAAKTRFSDSVTIYNSANRKMELHIFDGQIAANLVARLRCKVKLLDCVKPIVSDLQNNVNVIDQDHLLNDLLIWPIAHAIRKFRKGLWFDTEFSPYTCTCTNNADPVKNTACNVLDDPSTRLCITRKDLNGPDGKVSDLRISPVCEPASEGGTEPDLEFVSEYRSPGVEFTITDDLDNPHSISAVTRREANECQADEDLGSIMLSSDFQADPRPCVTSTTATVLVKGGHLGNVKPQHSGFRLRTSTSKTVLSAARSDADHIKPESTWNMAYTIAFGLLAMCCSSLERDTEVVRTLVRRVTGAVTTLTAFMAFGIKCASVSQLLKARELISLTEHAHILIPARILARAILLIWLRNNVEIFINSNRFGLSNWCMVPWCNILVFRFPTTFTMRNVTTFVLLHTGVK
ncbi:hypothetical protein WOLCODRAFT_16233 [Wolfiporia cocos MD-104 SS10]|uniref:Uncharacterized protein n=1 Tax=Wolfiporia cocos (strain MD-104) TaxID=742152 RepID=A0A2H3JJC3_WOLCO|nr:hypothetical protein WOLCODRAFT_16233 [Wolfiporia cocos MD-104 SS10]